MYDENIIFHPIYTVPNPLVNISDPDIATLTISMERFYKGGWVVSEDFRNKSVLTGLSDVGGLGSTLSTLLVLFLGTSLMSALLREFFRLVRTQRQYTDTVHPQGPRMPAHWACYTTA